jgi:hypothetical protein
MAAKKSYSKPEIRKIGLAPEECCITGCKTTAGTAKKNQKCHKAGACSSNRPGS